jgi:hypothetical protein
VVFFVGGTWLALGLRTGLGLALPAVCRCAFHFAVVYSVSALLAASAQRRPVRPSGRWCSGSAAAPQLRPARSSPER